MAHVEAAARPANPLAHVLRILVQTAESIRAGIHMAHVTDRAMKDGLTGDALHSLLKHEMRGRI